jgi:hypothetical protein
MTENKHERVDLMDRLVGGKITAVNRGGFGVDDEDAAHIVVKALDGRYYIVDGCALFTGSVSLQATEALVIA